MTQSARRKWWLGALVFIVAIAAMGRLSFYEFLDYDDRFTIYENPRLAPPTWESIGYYWTHSDFGLYVPGTYMVWAALAKLAWLGAADERGIRLNPWVFHTASVVLHALAAVVVFALLARLLGDGQ